MSLHGYFKISSKLPDPNGPLSKEVPSEAIKEANKSVERATKNIGTSECGGGKRGRGAYMKFTPVQQAQVAKYAVENGNQAAIRHYSKEFCAEVKKSTLSTWKLKYLEEIRKCHNNGEYDKSGEIVVSSLPSYKRGRPLLVGDTLDKQVQCYIRATRSTGGTITTTVVLAAGEAIVWTHNENLLHDEGGPIKLTRHWAKSLLDRMCFVKRKATTSAKVDPSCFDDLKEQYLLDIKAVVEMEKVPPELVLNWDHTGINIVPGSQWTMEEKGSKRVGVAGLNDKRQITVVFCASLAGEFLPVQLIYQGKTQACLPRYVFPDDWDITYTPNHWSNEEKMKEYIHQIILPYVQAKRKDLKLHPTHPALFIYDEFKGQLTPAVFTLLEENDILVVKVPPNCTDRLQPMDLSVNKAVKDFLRRKFQVWYSKEVEKSYQPSAPGSFTPVDLRMSTLKPLGAEWLNNVYCYLQSNNSLAINGFRAAGITSALEL